MSGNDRLKCSFCGKTQDQVKKLIAGPDVFICDECVELCNEILDEEFFEGKEKNLEGKEGEASKDEEEKEDTYTSSIYSEPEEEEEETLSEEDTTDTPLELTQNNDIQ